MAEEIRDPKFIHLRVHTAYSLAESAIRIPALVKLCTEFKMPAVAITDSNNMFGAMEFATYLGGEGIQPIMGTQILVSQDETFTQNPTKLVLLAQTEKGYKNLSYLLSKAYMETDEGFVPQVLFKDLKEKNADIICLTGGIEGPVGLHVAQGQKDKAKETLLQLNEIYPNRLYMEIQRHFERREQQTEDLFLDLAYEFNIPLVATNDCYFNHKGMYEAHDALLCIAEGRYVSEEDRRKVTPHHYFKNQEEMVKLFADLPEAIENTVLIAKRCSWFLKKVDPILPAFACEEGRTEPEELRFQSQKGLDWRLEKYVYPFCQTEEEKQAKKKEYNDRLDFELEVIIKMGFPGYFLIVSDFIQWAKDHNIPVGAGRGSGAASIVAWSLKITDLDPIGYGLLFERFLNPERVSMPDFDIDFCQDRRDEVISYVQEKYGKDRVAQIITFGKLQARAVVRDVGRVLQLPYGQVDRIAKLIPSNPANPVSLQEALDSELAIREEMDKDETVARLIDIALKLEGLYRHASTHAAGLVIADRPLHELCPIYRDPRSPMPVTQLNMKFVESAGLVKFDFLGLKTLTVLQKSVELVKEENNIDIDLSAIPVDDELTYKMLAKGDNTGVFQLESAGMRDAGRQMRLETLEEIIALVALYRPGPMDNIPQYIACKHGSQEQDFMHPLLKPILEETFGIMIYQEQVMQAAQILSGYSLGGADLLRRAMGKKIKEEMDEQRKIFVDGAKKHNDVPAEKASQIFDQIAKFAGYGFNKAHAACYAYIAYQTGYMKANYPVEFFAASMTLDMGNTDKLNIFSQELDRLKIELLPPDLNKSFPEFKVEILPDGTKAIRYALAAVKGVGNVAMQTLVDEREKNGPYKDIFDLASRLDTKVMNKRQIQNLIKAGAFDSLIENRAQLFNSVETIIGYSSAIASEKSSGQESLFGGPVESSKDHLPKLADNEDWDVLEKLQNEFDAIGFYLSAHPLDTDFSKLQRLGVVASNRLHNLPSTSTRVKLAGVVLKRTERTSAKGNKFAFISLSDPGGAYEVLIFSDMLYSNRDLLSPGNMVMVSADVQQQESEDEPPRLTGQMFTPLDEILKDLTKEIDIHISSADVLATIKEKISNDNGNVRVNIFMPVETLNTTAKIRLPGSYSITPAALRSIQALKDVVEVVDK